MCVGSLVGWMCIGSLVSVVSGMCAARMCLIWSVPLGCWRELSLILCFPFPWQLPRYKCICKYCVVSYVMYVSYQVT